MILMRFYVLRCRSTIESLQTQLNEFVDLVVGLKCDEPNLDVVKTVSDEYKLTSENSNVDEMEGSVSPDLDFYKNEAEVFEQKYNELKTTLELDQNTKTNANELADQTAFDSHSNQDKYHMHNTLCSDTTLQATDGLSDSVIILNDITSFEPNDNNIKQAHNPCKELNVDALLTQSDSHSYDRHYSIQRSNELHQSSPNIRQPIPTCITL